VAETAIKGYHYESENDPPGVSLRAPGPILAEQVEQDVVSIESSVATLDGDFSALEASIGDRVRRIATINTGTGTNLTEFTNIPQTFRDLMIYWFGGSDGTGELDTLALRFNGDSGNNYEGILSRNTETGTFSSSSGTFSVQRAGHVGTHRGAGVIHIPQYSTTGTYKMVTATSIARGNSGTVNTYTTQSGGRWSGLAAITAIRIWPSGQLWDINPHITLIGIP
jgi:hypothetical protein